MRVCREEMSIGISRLSKAEVWVGRIQSGEGRDRTSCGGRRGCCLRVTVSWTPARPPPAQRLLSLHGCESRFLVINICVSPLCWVLGRPLVPSLFLSQTMSPLVRLAQPALLPGPGLLFLSPESLSQMPRWPTCVGPQLAPTCSPVASRGSRKSIGVLIRTAAASSTASPPPWCPSWSPGRTMFFSLVALMPVVAAWPRLCCLVSLKDWTVSPTRSQRLCLAHHHSPACPRERISSVPGRLQRSLEHEG